MFPTHLQPLGTPGSMLMLTWAAGPAVNNWTPVYMLLTCQWRRRKLSHQGGGRASGSGGSPGTQVGVIWPMCWEVGWSMGDPSSVRELEEVGRGWSESDGVPAEKAHDRVL